MRTRLTIFLLALNIVLFATIIVLDKRVDLSRKAQQGDRTVLGPNIVENADALTIHGQRMEDRWELTRRKDGWTILSPVEWPANFYAVNRIITQLQFLVWESRFPVSDLAQSGQTLADYGLEEPAAVVTISSGGERYTIKIGDGTEIGSRLYVLGPDEREILVVNRELLESTAVELRNLRSDNVFDIPIFDVRFINMTFNPGNVKLRLAERDREWRIVTPLETEADSSRVRSLLNDLISLKIMDFQTTPAGDTGLSDPPVRLTLEATNRRQTLAVGNPLPERPHLRYARLEGNPTTFSISAETFENIRQAQDTLRERRFFPVSEHSVKQIEIEDEERAIILQRLESAPWSWQVLQRQEDGSLQTYPADGDRVRNLVKALNNIRAESFISDAPTALDLSERYGFGDPRRRIAVRQNNERVLVIGGLVPESSFVYAKTLAQDSVYGVRPGILMETEADANDFRETTLDALASGAVVNKITVTDLEKGRILFEQEVPTSETTTEQNNALSDPAELSPRDLARSLANHVRSFKVGRYLGNHFSESQFEIEGLDYPWLFRLDAEVTLPGGASGEQVQVTYYFTERVSGRTQFGGSAARNVVFSLPQNLIDLLYVATERPRDPAADSKESNSTSTTDEEAPPPAEEETAG